MISIISSKSVGLHFKILYSLIPISLSSFILTTIKSSLYSGTDGNLPLIFVPFSMDKIEMKKMLFLPGGNMQLRGNSSITQRSSYLIL